MTYENYSEEMWELLFGVRRSIRYHDRRMRRLNFFHRLTNYICVLSGSAASVAFVGKLDMNIGLIAALLVAALSGASLVFGFASRFSDHKVLRSRFLDLERAIVSAPEDQQYEQYVDKRLTIEADEPPKLHALDVLCHNELVAATYSRNEIENHFYKISWLARWTAQFIAWPNIGSNLR